MINVLVVDDHALFRRGVTAVINAQPDMKVVAEATNGREGIEAARRIHPDVVVMDLSMPEMGGTEATAGLVKELPETKVLMLTVSEKDEDLLSAIRAGARGYLLKGTDPEELVRAITHIAQGGVIISPYMAPRLIAEIGAPPDTPPREEKRPETALSLREMEILELVGQGLSDKQIAEKLLISLNTVKTHLKNILAKLHAKNRTEAVYYASKTETKPEDDLSQRS